MARLTAARGSLLVNAGSFWGPGFVDGLHGVSPNEGFVPPH